MSTRVTRKSQGPHSLVGSWVNGDEYTTDLEYIVGQAGDRFTVRAVDRFDGEEGAVYDINYEPKTCTLSFNVRWSSTGRFINVRLLGVSPNRVSYTYTFTENQMWFRKGTEPTANTKKSRRLKHGRKPKKQ